MKKFYLPFLIATGFVGASLNAATVLYDLSATKLAGTADANTFIALNGQTAPAGLTYNSSTPSLTWTQGTGSNYTTLFGYFTSSSLVNVNDSVSISYTLTPSAAFPSATDANFRLGLFSSGANTKLTANVATASSTFNTYTGYEAYYKVNGTGTAADSIFQKTGGTNNLLVSNSTTITGAPTLPVIGPGSITGTFTMTLSAVGQVTITSVVNGGAAQSVTDTSGISSTFDTFGFFAYPGASNSTVTFSNLTITSVPEPSTYALIGLAAVGMVICRKRSRKIFA